MRTFKVAKKILLIAAVWALSISVLSGGVFAQSRYEPWQIPDEQAASGTQGVVDELNVLIDAAERSRAASPAFLRDLRNLSRKYDNPWRRKFLSDDFSDGDFTANPSWVVTEGKFGIEPGFGLRGGFSEAAASETREKRDLSNEEVVVQILGGLLGQALGDGQAGSSVTASRSGGKSNQDRRAAIHVATAIGDAFSAEMVLTSWRRERGTLAINMYQGKTRQAGYRLIYRSRATPSFTLQSYSTRGVTDLANSSEAIVLEDKKPHVLTWTRDAMGRMSVSADGREILTAKDSGFRDPFEGVELVNTEGDYILRRIFVNGT